MSAAIQQAAISYFGLPDGTQMVEGGPMGHFAFTVPLTEEHLRGIADRMKALSEPAPQPERGEMIQATMPTQEELRDIWSAMPAKEQAIYGSFGVFARRATTDMPDIAWPQAVWMLGSDIDAMQTTIAMGVRSRTYGDEYLIKVDMLNEEQRIKYLGGV